MNNSEHRLDGGSEFLIEQPFDLTHAMSQKDGKHGVENHTHHGGSDHLKGKPQNRQNKHFYQQENGAVHKKKRDLTLTNQNDQPGDKQTHTDDHQRNNGKKTKNPA